MDKQLLIADLRDEHGQGILADTPVVSADLVEIGQVGEVRTTDFRLSMLMRRDLYVPASAVERLGDGRVYLTVTVSELEDVEWDRPSLFG